MRKPLISDVSYKIAEAVGKPEDYIRNAGLDDEMCKAYILKALKTTGPASKGSLLKLVDHALPDILTPEQKKQEIIKSPSYDENP